MIYSCKSSGEFNTSNLQENSEIIRGDTVKIVNEDTNYEVIIIDSGFSNWLLSRSFPRGYHSLSFLENKNSLWIREWNNRVLESFRYNPNLYQMQINYDPNIRYGYEVNYLIYNYLVYFQNSNNQQLFGRVPIR
ncbi:hypothetical protein FC1_06260 [Flavobacterium columnare NBRC 100251 = ATCC 23463]|nr:hypothetical protein FC1_06260 [Flavobacterium columnare NBRC 100251 = ATCC 23463]